MKRLVATMLVLSLLVCGVTCKAAETNKGVAVVAEVGSDYIDLDLTVEGQYKVVLFDETDEYSEELKSFEVEGVGSLHIPDLTAGFAYSIDVYKGSLRIDRLYVNTLFKPGKTWLIECTGDGYFGMVTEHIKQKDNVQVEISHKVGKKWKVEKLLTAKVEDNYGTMNFTQKLPKGVHRLRVRTYAADCYSKWNSYTYFVIPPKKIKATKKGKNIVYSGYKITGMTKAVFYYWNTKTGDIAKAKVSKTNKVVLQAKKNRGVTFEYYFKVGKKTYRSLYFDIGA